MIKYEIKKLFSNKLSIALIIICFLVNGYTIINKPNKIKRYYDDIEAYNKMYSDLQGDIDEEKVRHVTEQYNILKTKQLSRSLSYEYNPKLYTGYEYKEVSLYEEMYNKYQYILSYGDSIEKYKDYCKDNYTFYDDRYISSYYKSIYETYNNRTIEHFYKTKNYKYMFEYEFSNLCIIICLISLLAGIFSGDREKRMSELIVTSKNGKNRMFFGKILAGIIVSVILALVFIAEDVSLFISVFDLSHLNEPIYSVEEMQYCIYDISIWQYLLLSEAIRLVGVVALGGLIMLASSITSNQLSSVVTSTVIILPFIVVNSKNVMFNVIRLLHIREDVASLNIKYVFGNCTNYIYYSVIMCSILTVLLIIMAYLMETKAAKIIRRERC